VGNRVPRRLSILLSAFLLLSLLQWAPAQAAPLEVVERSKQPNQPSSAKLDPNRKLLLSKLTPAAMRAAEPLDMSVRHGQLDLDALTRLPRSTGPGVSVAPFNADGSMSTSSTQSGFESSAGPIGFVSSEVVNTADSPNRTHGKLFMYEGDTPTYVCSATVVNSATKNVVWTAGHCVHDGAGGSFFDNYAFVPGYRNENAPFGVWFAERRFTTDKWRQSTNQETALKHDVGALVMHPLGGLEIAEAVGARGIRFNQNPNHLYDSFGYPAEPPFNGQLAWLCDSEANMLLGDGNLAFMGIGCDMTGGSSGGGWIVDGQYVQSVNSFGIVNDPQYQDVMFGPQLRDSALDLYKTAVGASGPDTTAPKLTNVADGPDPFYPLGKRKKKTTIRFKLNEEADVSLTIKNRAGRTVAKLPPTRLASGRYSTAWYGRNEKTNRVVKAGRYTYRIKAKDLAKNTTTKSGRVTVKR
jgi:V8-like Glu-specific endopeptidase